MCGKVILGNIRKCVGSREMILDGDKGGHANTITR